jgi:hypothetical protein
MPPPSTSTNIMGIYTTAKSIILSMLLMRSHCVVMDKEMDWVKYWALSPFCSLICNLVAKGFSVTEGQHHIRCLCSFPGYCLL